jgi:ankyrin repeat protein
MISFGFGGSATKLYINQKNKLGETALFLAAQGQFRPIVEFLLSRSASPDIVTKDGWSPLHAAVNLGDLDITSLLVDSKAALNTKTKDGKTPLHFAVDKDNVKIAKLLITKGASINIADKDDVRCCST